MNPLTKFEIKENNRIIEEIHDSFYSMDMIVDTAIQRNLKLAYDENHTNKLKKLKDIGFNNSSSMQLLDKVLVKRDEELNDLLNEYSHNYPTYKFITDEDIVKLCKKYNLIIAPPQSYIGEIPLKNQNDIVNFESKHPEIKQKFMSKMLLNKFKQWNSFSNLDLERSLSREIYKTYNRSYGDDNRRYFDSTIAGQYLAYSKYLDKLEDPSLSTSTAAYVFNLYKKECNIKDKYVQNFLNGDGNAHLSNIKEMSDYMSNEIFIAATTDLLNIPRFAGINEATNTVLIDARQENPIHNRVPDPIVFKKLKRGALIITAWGIEASDELVVNQNNN